MEVFQHVIHSKAIQTHETQTDVQNVFTIKKQVE